MPRTARLTAEPLEPRDTPAVAITLDYRFDANGFFNDPSRKAALDQAVAAIAPRLQDSLSPITPGGSNTWRVSTTNPATNTLIQLNNQVIPADTIVVYPVGAPLSGSELGEANTGFVQAQGSGTFLNQVFGRGQSGAAASPATDYGPWGGFLFFDSTTDWSFSTAAPGSNLTDFLSVAEHEIIHLLGFTSGSESFDRLTSGGQFTGAHATALLGGPVPLADDSPLGAGHPHRRPYPDDGPGHRRRGGPAGYGPRLRGAPRHRLAGIGIRDLPAADRAAAGHHPAGGKPAMAVVRPAGRGRGRRRRAG